jgi:hypothetical protein
MTTLKRYTVKTSKTRTTGYFTVVHRINSAWYWHKTKSAAMKHGAKVTPWSCMVVNATTRKAIWKNRGKYKSY